jgi:glycosyltransferase involved in cell wall biosynthesis
MTEEAIALVKENSVTDNEIIVIDNGSDNQFQFAGVKIVRNEINIGTYPIYKQGLDVSSGDVIAFLHNDLFVWEKGWDKRVLDLFESNPKVGLVGFVWSTSMDVDGGRGTGTAGNFQGRQWKEWCGTLAELHGRRMSRNERAVVVDGLSMIFRKEALEAIGFVEDMPPHHFYDKLMSCQTIEKGWEVWGIGIECDHISYQTSGTQDKYTMLIKEWAKKYLDIDNCQEYCKREHIGSSPIDGWDFICYREAERRFLKEYRDNKHFIPLSISPAWQSGEHTAAAVMKTASIKIAGLQQTRSRHTLITHPARQESIAFRSARSLPLLGVSASPHRCKVFQT